MKKFIKNTLRRSYRILRALFKINWTKTLWVNFALLPFNQAIRLPVVVIGKLKIDSLHAGRIIFDCPVKYGLVIIGKCMDYMPIEINPTRITVNGTIIFSGHCIIGHSSNLMVWKNGKLILGNYIIICSGVLLKSAYSIMIGDYTRLTSGCFVMDTNVHGIKDAMTGRVLRMFNPIEIGKNCWLTMNTSVTAGAKVPDYSISTRGAVLNRDYTLNGERGCLLAGAPAKVIRTNVHRIFDIYEESKITRYFYDNPDAEYYQSELGFETSNHINNDSLFRI